jgi:hypothetical protein
MNITKLPTPPDTTTSQTSAQQGDASHGRTVRALANALANGDLQGASQAYAAIQQRQERVAQAANAPDSATVSARAQSFQQLGTALQGGNLQSAQQAFRQWRQAGTQASSTSTSGQSSSTAAPSTEKEKLLEAPAPKRHFFPRMVSPGIGGTIDIKV